MTKPKWRRDDEMLVARLREIAANLRTVGKAVNNDMMKMPEQLVMPRTVPLTLDLAAERLEQLSAWRKQD